MALRGIRLGNSSRAIRSNRPGRLDELGEELAGEARSYLRVATSRRPEANIRIEEEGLIVGHDPAYIGDTSLLVCIDLGNSSAATGEAIVGYVPKGILLGPRSARGGTPQNPPQDIPMPVYGEDLTTLIGHMVAGQGFVPLSSSAAPSVVIGSPSTGPSADPWGPLAVIPPEGGADTARTEGTLRITDECVFPEAQGEARCCSGLLTERRGVARRELSPSGTLTRASSP
jgi:hypothetical protein